MSRKTDPRITAYLLGELSPVEREAFEKQLTDGDIAGEVEALRELLDPLEEHFAGEPGSSLTAQQRARIERAVPKRSRAWLVPFAAAATLVVAAGLSVWATTGEREAATWPGEIFATGGAGGGGGATDDAGFVDVGGLTTTTDARAFSSQGVVTVDITNGLDSLNVRPPKVAASSVFFGDRGAGEYKGRVENLFDLTLEFDESGGRTETYDRVVENPVRRTVDRHVSTFSIDVDTASYSNVRRHLRGGSLPPPDAVRLEELVNYFSYDYAPPRAGAHPFRANVEVAGCPWNTKRRLVRIALKGRTIPVRERPPSNLVFLLDVSGSMRDANKLPLVQQSLKLLLEKLDEGDRVAIVVYAGASGLALDSTPANELTKITQTLGKLHAGGSTNGGAGIELAYSVAQKHFVRGGVNRVILCTDGDFNVGVTDRGQLTRLIEEKAKSGVYLSILGYGMGNLKDATMEDLSNKGNGNYAYIDTLREAKKVLVDQMSGTLVTIAKDVKIQVFFNPKTVAAWRLVGYENRVLKAEDFNDDQKDAGEIGAGHAVTALYEIVPIEGSERTAMQPKVDENPYVDAAKPSARADSGALLMLRLRYKQPDGDKSTLMETEVTDSGGTYDAATEDLRWASAVAGFGLLLRRSKNVPDLTWDGVLEIAQGAVGNDIHGYRKEFLELVQKASDLAK